MIKQIKKESTRREKSIASAVGGKAHAGSGATWYRKSDASDPFFQYEDKFTYADKYSLSLASLKKIEKEAQGVDKIPIFRFGFVVASKKSEDYVVIRKQDYLSHVINNSIIAKKSKVFLKDELATMEIAYKTGALAEIIFSEDNIYLLLSWEKFLTIKTIIMGEV
jgi:hypothetical protein